MPPSFKDYLCHLKPDLDEIFKRRLSELVGDVSVRNGSALRAVLEGGKKVRGCFVCLTSQALGGSRESAMPRAVAVELIQTATLIHDDFVDQDATRRNLSAAWTLEGARRAVLLGDVIFASAIEMMNDVGKEDGSVVSRAIAQLSNGALKEPLDPLALGEEIEDGRVDGRLYEKIIYLKTGVLFGAACKLGAIAAQAEEDLRERFYRYGARIGEAYQLADDLEDLRRHMRKGSIGSGEMALLAPAFLRFAKGMRVHLSTLLRGERFDLDGRLLKFFQLASARMEKEIERRLRFAVSLATRHVPKNRHGDLIRSAPRELIDLFNES